MARLAALVLLGTALGVSAHPRHGHLHNKQRNVEEKRAGEVIDAVIDGQTVSWTMSGSYYAPSAAADVDVNVAVAATTLATSTTAAAAVVAASTSAAATAVATGSSSSGSSSSGVTSYISFEDNCSSASKRATKEEIAQVGNTGTEDGAYGCNYILVSTESVAEAYDNYVQFYGATEDMTCYYWNKIAKDGSIAGWYTSMDSYSSFSLPAGETQYLAIQNGTGGAGTCQPASLAPVTDADSALLYTWIEWDAVDVTTTWSAFDVSSIMAQNADGTVNGVEACTLDDTTCSSISAGAATVTNAFDATLAAADGLGYNTAGTLKFKVNLGF